MANILEKYTREQLEKKLLHIVDFISYKLGEDFVTRINPEAKIIRTAEAEHENDERIKELMVAIYPAWDIVLALNPNNEYLTEWVAKNHEKILVGACTCAGCKE